MRGELEARRETAVVDLGMEDVMTNQLIGPRAQLWAGRRQEGRAESSGDGSSRVGRGTDRL